MQETDNKHGTAALQELIEHRQWVAWEYREQGKRKVPINPHTWRDASPTDSSTWGAYDEALFCAGNNAQVGFVFSPEDGFCGIDLDNCIDRGEVAPWALEIVEALDSYTEVSPSETGLKIWVRGRKPGVKCRTGNVEIYDKTRFFTFTGRVFHRGSIEDRQIELERLYYRLFPEQEHQTINTVVVGSGFNGEDAELLEKARTANTTGKLFARLYDLGDTSMYSYDESRADLALCGMLAYWTGRDDERMDRLFRSSKLMRKKWDERRVNSTYGDNTIAKAIKGCRNVYDPNYKAVVNEDVREILEGCLDLVVFGSWGSGTDRDVFKALINTGFLYGRKVKDGVSVAASERVIALAANVGRTTARTALRRLEERGLIRRLESGNKKKASKYLIRGAHREPINKRVNNYGSTLRATSGIRNPSRYYGTIGKRNGQILDYVNSLGRAASLDEIAKLLGARARDIKIRNIALLLELELLKPEQDGYVTPADIEERLERELEESGCKDASELQRQRYERERLVQRVRLLAKDGYTPEKIATETDLDKGTVVELLKPAQKAQPTVLILNGQEPVMVNPVAETKTVKRSCYLDAQGIVHHVDPLCDDDCEFSFGFTQRIREQELAA
jgi:putative DNA primase/helicase